MADWDTTDQSIIWVPGEPTARNIAGEVIASPHAPVEEEVDEDDLPEEDAEESTETSETSEEETQGSTEDQPTTESSTEETPVLESPEVTGEGSQASDPVEEQSSGTVVGEDATEQ